eukprot:6892326-Pyramimonas_sp.AAC.1
MCNVETTGTEQQTAATCIHTVVTVKVSRTEHFEAAPKQRKIKTTFKHAMRVPPDEKARP